MIYTKNKAFINEMEFYCFKDYNKPKIHKLKTFYHGDMNKVVVREDKNNEFLARIGMTPKERENIILSLESWHYIKGPVSDHKNHGEKEIWVFK